MAATAEQLDRWSRELLRIETEMEETYPEQPGTFPPPMLGLTRYAWHAVVTEQAVAAVPRV